MPVTKIDIEADWLKANSFSKRSTALRLRDQIAQSIADVLNEHQPSAAGAVSAPVRFGEYDDGVILAHRRAAENARRVLSEVRSLITRLVDYQAGSGPPLMVSRKTIEQTLGGSLTQQIERIAEWQREGEALLTPLIAILAPEGSETPQERAWGAAGALCWELASMAVASAGGAARVRRDAIAVRFAALLCRRLGFPRVSPNAMAKLLRDKPELRGKCD
jgi:hypothetical protein